MGFFKEFFYFQKSDRRVLIVALTVAVLSAGAVFLLGRCNSETPVVGSGDESVPGAASDSTSGASSSYYAVEGRRAELFPFDPNTADSTQLLRLGLQPWQVRNIYRYRAQGGVYSRPEDFARLYGLTAGQYRELAPYIRIGRDYLPASEVYGRRGNGTSRHPRSSGRTGSSGYPGSSGYSGSSGYPGDAGYVRDTLLYPVKLREGEHISLSTADTTQLRKVPGIGSYFARRIVRYREQLGGFYDVRQLLEIEGFPEEALPYFDVDATQLRKIQVNVLKGSQLYKHPYVSINQARAIERYRRLKGPIHDISQLRLLPEFPQELIDRLAPYLSYE